MTKRRKPVGEQVTGPDIRALAQVLADIIIEQAEKRYQEQKAREQDLDGVEVDQGDPTDNSGRPGSDQVNGGCYADVVRSVSCSTLRVHSAWLAGVSGPTR